MKARSVVATTLVVVTCVLAPLAVSAVWVHRTIYDTDGYVATVSPLARKAAIERALIHRTVAVIDEELERRLDPDPDAGALRRRLDQEALAAGHRAAEEAATRVVRSDQFAQLWDRLNREGHAEALTWFSGDSSQVRAGVADDKLVISLQPLVEEVAQRIEGVGVAGFHLSGDRIRRLDPEIVLVDGPLVEPIQRTLRTLDGLALPLSLLTLAGAIGAVVAAPDRRRVLARLGIGLTIAMAVVLVALRIGREEFLDWIDTTSVSVPASTAFFDTVVRDLRGALLIGLVLGIGIALAARFAGRSGDDRRRAARLRCGVRRRARGRGVGGGGARRPGGAGHDPESDDRRRPRGGCDRARGRRRAVDRTRPCPSLWEDRDAPGRSLNSEERAALAGQLIIAREETERRVAGLTRDFDAVVAASEGSNADDEHDPEGQTIGYERAQITALLDEARLHLVEIEAAQRRLQHAPFESCAGCGRRIPFERLLARPVTTVCVDCAAARGGRARPS